MNGTTDFFSCSGNYDDTLLNYLPQIVILQLGICDCSPRYLRTNSLLYKILRRFPSKYSSLLWYIIKKVRKRDLNCTDVSLVNFKKNLVEYIKMCRSNGVEKIIIIAIATPGEAMIKANPMVLTSINLYNSVYKDLSFQYNDYVEVVNPISKSDSSLFVEDGYHTNNKGHNLIIKELRQSLLNHLASRDV